MLIGNAAIEPRSDARLREVHSIREFALPSGPVDDGPYSRFAAGAFFRCDGAFSLHIFNVSIAGVLSS